MELHTFDHDIRVLTVDAESFPDGIMDAHEELHALIPFSEDRRYFGISRPENGAIVYCAGAEELQPGEAEKWNCGTVVLKKGNYLCIHIEDYMEDTPSIRQAFERLLAQPGIDQDGYCVEWYVSKKEVNCMVRLSPATN
jgi:hypothetical protein